MGTIFHAAAVWGQVAHKFNMGKGKNRDAYSVLDVELTDSEAWWDTLNFNQKMDIGSIAIHFSKMTGNYKWNTESKYKDLKKSQKTIIAFVLKQKDEQFSMFPLQGLLRKYI
jgi:hypothetical protein